jgi:hypothetical protein
MTPTRLGLRRYIQTPARVMITVKVRQAMKIGSVEASLSMTRTPLVR